MKKLFNLIFLGSFMIFLIPSCTEKTDSAEKFSKQTVEENKTIVENSGIDFIQVMDRMRSLKTIDAVANLSDIMSSSGAKGIGFLRQSKLFSAFETVTAAAKGDKKVNDVFDAMISSKGEDPESIQQFWNENVGTYTWNKSLSDWDIVLGGNKFIFYFPASDLAVTNNAVFTISNYTGVTISNPVDEDYTGDLPVSINADLKVGSETLVTFVFGAEYNTDGVPKAIAADLDIEGFKFEIDIANTTEVVSVSYKFLEGSNVIMKLTASGEGLFTEENYNDNTTHYSETYSYYDYIWNEATQQYDIPVLVEWTDEWQETDGEEIIHSAKADFQLFDVAIRGEIDIKNLVDQMKIINENESLSEKVSAESSVEKINQYLNLRLVNVPKNEIMAKAEAYVVHEINQYYEDYYVDFRLTFSDGSPIDIETYFDNGFDSFIDEVNSLINDLNTEYDLGLEPVDY